MTCPPNDFSTPHVQAHATFDPRFYGVRIHIRTGQALRCFQGGGPQSVLIPQDGSRLSDEDEDRATLRLHEDEARALYEALGEFFGHAGASTQALRRDYDAERKRVDRFIEHLTDKEER